MGRVIYRATFRDHIVIGGTPYPERIDIAVHEPERANINVQYLDMEISREKDAAVFDLQTPPGVTTVITD